jgi:hypothetical protein
MNENRMKTSVNPGEVSSPPARGASWGVEIAAQEGSGSEKQVFGVQKRLDKPSTGRIIAQTTAKTQFAP